MTAEEFAEFRHNAVHELMRLNDECDREFKIASWPHWDYDLDRATLIFSEESVPKVIASIQVVGTTSKGAGTWLWAWANDSLPSQSTQAMLQVKGFGEREKIAEVSEPEMPDDEYLGWALTAIAAHIL